MIDGEAKIGPFLAMMVVAGGMIGSGVYLLPASLAAFGSISILGWLLAILGSALLAGVYSALAILRPGEAGLFSHIQDALGPGVGFVAGLLYWFPVASVPIALAVTGYLGFFVPAVASGVGSTVTTLAVIWLILAVNYVGPRFVSRFSGWTLFIGLAPILLVAIAGWFFFSPAVFAASWNVTGHSALDVVPASAVQAFWALVGLEYAAIVAPMVRDPARNVPIATFGGLAIAAVVYLSASAVIMGLMPASELVRSSAPFADAARPWIGGGVAAVIALCAMLKAAGALGSSNMALMEAGECGPVSGHLFPGRPPRTTVRPPAISFVIFGVIMSLAVVLSASPILSRQFTVVTNVIVVIETLVYLCACLALIRFSGLAPAPWRWPLRATAAGGGVFCVAIVAASERDLLIWSVAAVAMAAAIYLGVSARRRAVRPAAGLP